MASETVDPIDWPLPHPFTGQYSLSATCKVQMHATNLCEIDFEQFDTGQDTTGILPVKRVWYRQIIFYYYTFLCNYA